jgi:hypothetical protein
MPATHQVSRVIIPDGSDPDRRIDSIGGATGAGSMVSDNPPTDQPTKPTKPPVPHLPPDGPQNNPVTPGVIERGNPDHASPISRPVPKRKKPDALSADASRAGHRSGSNASRDRAHQRDRGQEP